MAGLPQLVQSASGKSFDANSPQGKMIVNSPNYKNPFDNQSSALAITPQGGSALSLAGSGGMSPAGLSPMESMVETFQSMLNSLLNIEDALVEQSAVDQRNESLNDADVPPEPTGRDDDPINKKPGFLKRIGSKFSMAGLLKGGLILALTGIMAFADEFAELLQPILKFIKEKAWPNAVDVFTDFMEKGRLLFSGLADKLSIIFGDSGGPHGVTLMDRVKAFAGIFMDIGGFILGIGNSLITNVLEMFGVNFAPYDSAGAWVLGKLNEMWTGISNFFEGIMPEWMPGFSDIGAWVVDKVTTAFKGITKFFSGAISAFQIGGKEGGEGGFASLGAYLLDALKSPIKFITDLFAFPEKPEEGYFSFKYAGQVFTKFIDFMFLPFNLAINFLMDIFGFSDEEAKKSEDYKPFKVSDTIVKVYTQMWEWLTDKFTFDPSKITGKIFEFGTFISAITQASAAALMASLPFGESPGDEFKRVFDNVMQSGQSSTVLNTGGGSSGATLRQEGNAAFRLATRGAGMTIIDNSVKGGNSSSGDTFVADLGTDHQESTVKPAGDKSHLRNK